MGAFQNFRKFWKYFGWLGEIDYESEGGEIETDRKTDRRKDRQKKRIRETDKEER